MDIFKKDQIIFDEISETQDEVFQVIAKEAEEHGFVKDQSTFFKALKKREETSTTGFKDYIAIPHAKDATVKEPGIFLIKLKNEIPWNSLDSKPVKVAIALTIPEEGAKEHLKILSLIARELIDDDFRESLLEENDVEILYDLINQISF